MNWLVSCVSTVALARTADSQKFTWTGPLAALSAAGVQPLAPPLAAVVALDEEDPPEEHEARRRAEAVTMAADERSLVGVRMVSSYHAPSSKGTLT